MAESKKIVGFKKFSDIKAGSSKIEEVDPSLDLAPETDSDRPMIPNVSSTTKKVEKPISQKNIQGRCGFALLFSSPPAGKRSLAAKSHSIRGTPRLRRRAHSAAPLVTSVDSNVAERCGKEPHGHGASGGRLHVQLELAGGGG